MCGAFLLEPDEKLPSLHCPNSWLHFRTCKKWPRQWSETHENRWMQMSQISVSNPLDVAVWGWLEWKSTRLNGTVFGRGLLLNRENRLCLTLREQKSRTLIYLRPTSRKSGLKTTFQSWSSCLNVPYCHWFMFQLLRVCLHVCILFCCVLHQRFYITPSPFFI